MPDETPTIPAKCLRCKADLATPIVCEGCRTLYPAPQTADYFDLLNLERTYAIDEGKLTAAFRAITRNIHPDRVSSQPEEVRVLATRLSANINQAYTVLKDPIRRAGYMLELAGGPSAAKARDVPGNLLAEVMAMRERIEDAHARQDPAELANVRTTVRARRAETLAIIAQRADQLTDADESEKTEFRRLINSVKYFDNILAEVHADPLADDGDHNLD